MIYLRRKINEAYYPKSRYNKDTSHMNNVFMTPSDEFDTETGKFEEDAVPEKMSYSELIGRYEDFCSNYIDAYDTEDEHWTFIYLDGSIINQDGDKGYYYDRFEHKRIKRDERKLDPEDRFKAVPRRGLVAIIWNNDAEERFWYKNEIGKELLINYTGWSFEDFGDQWL